MPTTKKRINITLPPEVDEALAKVAARDAVPQATKAVQLLKVAIEIDEDDIFNILAERRDTPNAKFKSHKEAWK